MSKRKRSKRNHSKEDEYVCSTQLQPEKFLSDNENSGKSSLHNLQQMRCDTDKVIKKSSLVADLRRVASDKGFVISDNAAGGNCMFYSLTDQLKRVKDRAISHGELRRTLVRFLREHSSLSDGTPLVKFVPEYPSWHEYLASMEKDGTWGDHLVLIAAAKCFKTHIRVISSLGHDLIISSDHPVTNSSPLVLGHIDEEHYVSLHPRLGKHKGTMAPSNSDLPVTLDVATDLMDNADKIKKAYISLISSIKEKKGFVCDAYDKVSYALGCLLDPDEGYILLARQLAGLSTLITDALNLKTEIPKEMVPQIERLKGCADNAEQALQRMRDRIEPLLKYLGDAIYEDKPIDKNKEKRKLQFIILHRNQCKDYLEKAHKEMSDLTKMASSRLLLCGIGVGRWAYNWGAYKRTFTIGNYPPAIVKLWA